MGSGILDKTKEKFDHAIDSTKKTFNETKEDLKRAVGADGYTRIPTAPELWVERIKCVGSSSTIDKVVDEAVAGTSSDKPAQSRKDICNKEIQEKYDGVEKENQKLYDQRTKDKSTTSGVYDPHALLLASIQEAKEMAPQASVVKQL